MRRSILLILLGATLLSGCSQNSSKNTDGFIDVYRIKYTYNNHSYWIEDNKELDTYVDYWYNPSSREIKIYDAYGDFYITQLSDDICVVYYLEAGKKQKEE